jgi:hypothetical protein
LVFGGTQSYAGILSGHPDAYGGWTGTVAFNNGLGLHGTLDYAVFTAGQFNANFSGLGYVPSDAVVYAYQLFNDDAPALDISRLTVDDVLPASGIGSFNLNTYTPGGIAPTGASFVGGDARWTFNNEIPPSTSSFGLAYSSPNLPENTIGIVIDGGTPALVLEIPAPSDIPIPEPTSLVLLSLGLLLIGRRGRRN